MCPVIHRKKGAGGGGGEAEHAAATRGKSRSPTPTFDFGSFCSWISFSAGKSDMHAQKASSNGITKLVIAVPMEEEKERSNRWNNFLDKLVETFEAPPNDSFVNSEGYTALNVAGSEDNDQIGASGSDGSGEIATQNKGKLRTHKIQRWSPIRSSLIAIEQMLSYRVKKLKQPSSGGEAAGRSRSCYTLNGEERRGMSRPVRGEEESLKKFDDGERPKPVQEASSSSCMTLNEISHFPWKEELESLVQGGLPMTLRGELWQAFVGTKARRIEGYYDELLALEAESSVGKEDESYNANDIDNNMSKGLQRPHSHIEKLKEWKEQIEKDLPRTFPGHPTLDEHRRNSLRHLLMAYARHNPSVGYFQDMNFFGGLLLLLMPEENAFWTLVGIIDDYFDGYYYEGMIDFQVDQLVLEDLVRERFPALVSHLEYLGVQISWITGPWFLSIFVNTLPWESVLRAWDVFLFDGNRVMLFQTALALMELYGPHLQTTKDAGEAVSLLQTLVGSTFHSSQLILAACMDYQTVNEMKLEHTRRKHRPDVIAAMEANCTAGSHRTHRDLYPLKSGSAEAYFNLTVGDKLNSVPDLKEQVNCLKIELCRLLEEKRSAVLRAEELEMAFMEMVQQDNRRLLTVNVEQLEQEVIELQQALSEKQQKENFMRQVLLRMEQEQKVMEQTQMLAEQDAAAQKYAAHMLQKRRSWDIPEEALAATPDVEAIAMEQEVACKEFMVPVDA
ncbi:TBC1 domain family member 2A-like [Canna indica]|uniref:TBC1 domain family member 2A-like n=1 Tax=Canna indica TaxID=4628 RepID=A0AAQ3KA53_9LILI|nr:TBC1 domain family member 2A-like [Canna indica]